MRIVKNGDVHVSAPFGMSKKDVEAFIQQHQEWIVEARKRITKRLNMREAFFHKLPLTSKEQKVVANDKVRALVEPMLERHAKVMGVSPSSVSYKPMISRWGVYKVNVRSICFSTYLLLLPDWCVEHVVVHELCHLMEPSHNNHFHALMDTFYPKWREARKEVRRIIKND